MDSWRRWRCDPGDAITFTPLLKLGNTPATCPTVVDWDFGDGTTLTSSDPSVTHTYTRAGWYFGDVFARILGDGESDFALFIAAGEIGFESPGTTYVIDEGQRGFIPVVRTGNLSRPGTIDYRVSNQIQLSGTLAFGAGEARKDVVIEPVDDAVSDGQDDSAWIDLSNPTGGWVLKSSPSPNRVYVQVRDNDVAADHQCAQTVLQADERAGKVTFELTRSQNTSVTTTGRVGVSNWPDPLVALLVTFAPGETTRFIDLPWENNSVYHGTREWNFTCGGSGPGASKSLSHGTLTITDDEPYPTLITPASIEVTETDSPQQMAIPLTFVPPFGYFVEVDAVLQHETSSDADVKLLPLRFPYAQIELEIDGDDLPEPDESLYLRVSGPVQKGISVTIRDDDRPPFPFTFDRESYEFDEGLGGSVMVQRTGSSSSPVQLLLIIDPNIPGAAVETIPVLLASGESSKEVPLGLDDAYFTGTRSVTLKLELDGFVGATASVLVRDNEVMPSLSVGDGSVQEGNPGQFPGLEFVVTLTAPVGGSLELTLSPSHVSTDDADFRAAPQSITIPQGELKASAVFFVTGDSAHEADETFNVTITSCCEGLAAVARPTGTATIVNDDAAPPPPTETLYRLALGATPVKEADRWLSIPVHRSGIVSVATHAILKLTASDERVFAPGMVSFAPNETENAVQFYINDFFYSGNTIVNVELFDGDRLIETQSVTILDDEPKPGVFARGGTGREGNATNAAPLRFTVSPPSRKPIILGLHARSGTAKLGEDFPAFDKSVEIPPGVDEYEVLVPIHNDRIREATETFSVDITVDGVMYSSRTIAIADDDTTYVVSEPNVERGTLSTISVYFATPAPAKDEVLFLADAATFEGPLSVPVPAGASNVSFQVLAKRSGQYSFAILTPTFMPAARIVTDMNIFDEQSVTVTPAALELAPGTSARFVVTTSPARQGFTMRWPDWTIAAIEKAPDVDGDPSFLVYGLVPGQTEIVVKLPAAAGGATARLLVVVKEPEKPGRKRATRH